MPTALTTRLRRLRRVAIGATSLALATTAVGAGVLITAAPAGATTALPGSVMYDKGGDVFVTDGSATRQITHDGGTASADKTGNSGYGVPSESDDGSVVVAVRNQDVVNASDAQTYKVGYLWVMDAYGNVIRKVRPPQFPYESYAPPCGSPGTNPQGIVSAQVSPDGTHIAYTYTELIRVYEGYYGCDVETAYHSAIVRIDGTDPVQIDDGSGSATAAEDIEIGSWAGSGHIIVDRGSFGEVEAYVASTTSPHAQPWFGPSDLTDTAYLQGALRNHVLVTQGLSSSSADYVVRVWSAPDLTTTPTASCERASTVDTGGDSIYDPVLAPDGSTVAYEDVNHNGSLTKAGQGIYVMATAGATCGTPQLLVGGALDAFWSAAPVAAPPAVHITAAPAASSRSSSGNIGFGSGPADAQLTCSLDHGTARACTSPFHYSGLADGTHTFTVTVSADGKSASATTSWRIDTTAPTVTLSAPTARGTTALKMLVRWTGRDTGTGVARYQLQERFASSYKTAFGTWTNLGHALPAADDAEAVTGFLPGQVECVRVRATDAAGNTTASAPRCIAFTLDDRSLSRSSGWHGITGSGYYRHTAVRATARNATLTLRHATAARIGVVVTVGRGRGKLGVYVGSRLIGTVDTAAATSRNRVIRWLPAFGLRTSTVHLKVLTRGKAVTVDGVLLPRQ